MMTTGNAMRTTIDDLTERVEVQYFDHRRDAAGNLVSIATQPHTRCVCWAKVYPISADIGQGTQATENKVSYRLTVRYRDDILPDDLIVWRGKTLALTAPPYDAESRRKWTILDAKELIADGANQ